MNVGGETAIRLNKLNAIQAMLVKIKAIEKDGDA
jgi:hypothetical protein